MKFSISMLLHLRGLTPTIWEQAAVGLYLLMRWTDT